MAKDVRPAGEAKREKDRQVTESSEDSFPASDPPSFNPGVAAPIDAAQKPAESAPRTPSPERVTRQRRLVLVVAAAIILGIIALMLASRPALYNAPATGVSDPG